MRVAIVTPLYPTPQYPWHGTFIRDQARSIALAGAEVRVFHADVRSVRTMHRAMVRGPDVSPAPGDPVVERRLGWTLGALTIPTAMRLAGERLARAASSGPPPDVVHGHFSFGGGDAALAMARRFACPLVVTEHSSEFSRGLVRGRRARSIRLVAEAANELVAVSDDLARRFEEAVGRSVEIIPNVVDVDNFPPRTSHPSGQPLRIVAVGSLNPKKGFDILIEALAGLQAEPWHATIVGQGPEAGRLAALARRAGMNDRIKLVGSLPRSQIRALLEGASLFVAPSRHETFGVAIAEALSVGVPVVATPGGPSSFVRLPFGVIAQADPAAIRRAIEAMVASPPGFDPRASHERVRAAFAPEIVGQQLMGHYRRLAAT